MSSRIPSTQTGRAGYTLTLGGLLFVAMLLLLAVAAVNNKVNLLLLLFGIGASAVGANFILSARSLSKLTLERTLPPTAVAGETCIITYRITNPKKRAPAFSIYLVDKSRVEQQHVLPPIEAYEPFVAPRGETRITVPTILSQRGPVTFSGIRIESRFPFGLVRRYCRFLHEETMLVSPAFLSLRRPLAESGGFDPEARVRRQAYGNRWFQGGEFAGLREYRHGDNPRLIHWKKTASSRQLRLHERRHPTPEHLTLVLDLRPPAASDGKGKFELLISAVATMGCEALARGYYVGLIALAAAPVVLPPAGGSEQRDRLLSQLALVRAGGSSICLHDALADVSFHHYRGGTGYLLSCEDRDAAGATMRLLSARIGRFKFLHPESNEFRDQFRLPDDSPKFMLQDAAI